MRFSPVPADAPPARELIAAMVAEVADLYGGSLASDPRSPSATPADFAAPHGTCMVGFRGGRAVCVGAVKRLYGDVAEIKRMYVVPDERGRGVGAALLDALEDAARALGHRRVRLDTGSAQPHALALYRRAGYAPIADYNGNPYAAWWGEKRLAGPEGRAVRPSEGAAARRPEA